MKTYNTCNATINNMHLYFSKFYFCERKINKMVDRFINKYKGKYRDSNAKCEVEIYLYHICNILLEEDYRNEDDSLMILNLSEEDINTLCYKKLNKKNAEIYWLSNNISERFEYLMDEHKMNKSARTLMALNMLKTVRSVLIEITGV